MIDSCKIQTNTTEKTRHLQGKYKINTRTTQDYTRQIKSQIKDRQKTKQVKYKSKVRQIQTKYQTIKIKPNKHKNKTNTYENRYLTSTKEDIQLFIEDFFDIIILVFFSHTKCVKKIFW